MASHAMLKFEREESDLRLSPRYRVLLVAKLITTAGERVVKLRDLSTTGAMIEGEKIPPAGTDILLRRGALEQFATVVWNEDKQAGLEFDEPLTQAELWMQVNAPPLPDEPPKAPPEPPRIDLSAWPIS